MSQEDKLMERTVTRKLHWHIMSRFCVLTVLNNLDRANMVRCYCSAADLHVLREGEADIPCTHACRRTRRCR
jgi:hypothetical protein